MSRRTLAIGDIHGCSAALAALLLEIDPGRDDRIITLGDYVDRGPDSSGTLDLLIDLTRRCELIPLLGNHDQVMLEVRANRINGLDWLGMGGLATLASYGAAWGELDRIPAAHWTFLESCRPAYETETHLFVHAQYNACLSLDEQSEDVLRWLSLKHRIPQPHLSGKRAIVGHSAQKSGEVLDLGYLVCIDTYCYGGKWLTALDVETGRIWQADAGGRLRARADRIDLRASRRQN